MLVYRRGVMNSIWLDVGIFSSKGMTLKLYCRKQMARDLLSTLYWNFFKRYFFKVFKGNSTYKVVELPLPGRN